MKSILHSCWIIWLVCIALLQPSAFAQTGAPGKQTSDRKVAELQKRIDELQAQNDKLRQQLEDVAANSISKQEVEQLFQKLYASQKKKEEEPAKTQEPEVEHIDQPKQNSDKINEVPRVESSVIGEDTSFKAKWKNGLSFSTADKAFHVHVGGRIHADVAWLNGDHDIQFGPGGVGPLEDGVDFRRARIHVHGRMYEVVEWMMEYGFENGTPMFFDVFGQITQLPYIGTVRIGHFREPFSMDAWTSGNSLMLMERSLLQDAFVPFRNTGIMALDTAFDDRMTWAVGGFRSNSNGVGAADGNRNYAATGRWTVNPWYENDGAYALHFGVAGSYRHNPNLNASGQPVSEGGLPRTRFATRPEIRVSAPNFADTGYIVSDHSQLLGLEFGLGLGSLLIQSEWIAAFVDDPLVPGAGPAQGSAFLHGFYVQAGYFLTGENRPYNQELGVFGALIPNENFYWLRGHGHHRNLFGRGAWEIATRYSYLDLDDGIVSGGRLQDWTLGLNWYLNPNCRFMTNYILSWRDAPGNASHGLARIFGARFQVDF